jgi:hypothetical protein
MAGSPQTSTGATSASQPLRGLKQAIHPAPTSAARLFWTLDSLLISDAIYVLPSSTSDPSDAALREPLYDALADTWHPVADAPASEPGVSSIAVDVHALREWLAMWCDEHGRHSEPPYFDADEEVREEEEGWKREEVGVDDADHENHAPGKVRRAWRAVKLADPASMGYLGEGAEWRILELADGGMEEKLMRCDGEQRPGPARVFEVLVTGSGKAGCVTVQDFVAVVHPWLMGLQREIRAAMGLMKGDVAAVADGVELVVDARNLTSLRVEEKDDWVAWRNGTRPVGMSRAAADAVRCAELARAESATMPWRGCSIGAMVAEGT